MYKIGSPLKISVKQFRELIAPIVDKGSEKVIVLDTTSVTIWHAVAVVSTNGVVRFSGVDDKSIVLLKSWFLVVEVKNEYVYCRAPRKFDLLDLKDSFFKDKSFIEFKDICVPRLKSYQNYMLKVWIEAGYRAIWGLDMGLGKTFTAGYILYRNAFYRRSYKFPVVFTKASIIPIWEELLNYFCVPYVVLTNATLETVRPKEGVVSLCSFEAISYIRVSEEYIDSAGNKKKRRVKMKDSGVLFTDRVFPKVPPGVFDLIVIDECHAVNNASSITYKYISRIATKDVAVLAMSGTIFGNGWHEIYPISVLISPLVLGVFSQNDFYYTFCRNESRNPAYTDWRIIPERIPLLKEFLKKYAVFADLPPGIELPPLLILDHYYMLTDEQKDMQKKIAKDCVWPLSSADPEWLKELFSEGIPIASPSAIRHFRRTLCAGHLSTSIIVPGMPEEYTEAGYPLYLNVRTNKMEELFRCLDSCTDVTMIWTQYRHTTFGVANALIERYGKKEVSMVIGGMSEKKRALEIERFLKGETRFMVAPTDCLGTGGTYLRSTLHIVYELPDSFIEYAQSIKRSHRINQDKPVRIIRFIAKDSIETRILKSLVLKKDFQEDYKKSAPLFKDTGIKFICDKV